MSARVQHNLVNIHSIRCRLVFNKITATIQWTGILTSLLLIGWSIGGILFGYVADRFGRMRTLQITIGK